MKDSLSSSNPRECLERRRFKVVRAGEDMDRHKSSYLLSVFPSVSLARRKISDNGGSPIGNREKDIPRSASRIALIDSAESLERCR